MMNKTDMAGTNANMSRDLNCWLEFLLAGLFAVGHAEWMKHSAAVMHILFLKLRSLYLLTDEKITKDLQHKH